MAMRKYKIDLTADDGGAASIIRMYKDGLERMRGSTDHPDELEWEIRLYDFILEDPAPRLKAYQEARFPDDGAPIEKREVIRILGWNVP
jgi:hypothetical protein